MISLVVNLDSRPSSLEFKGLGNGVRSSELLVAGLRNKRKFFDGFEIELIAYIDEHERIPADTLNEIRGIADCVVVRKHTKHYRSKAPFNDFNSVSMLNALSLARGDYLCHMDMDVAVFGDENSVESLLDLIPHHKFICYPSKWSPKPIADPSFGNHVWASTRFFLTHRTSVPFDEIYDAIEEPFRFYQKHGTPPRVCPWLEHYLGQASGYSVFYPPEDYSWMAFCWNRYAEGTLPHLDSLSYPEQVAKIKAAGGMGYDGVDATRIPR